MNTSKNTQRTLWVLEERTESLTMASDTEAAVDSLLAKLKAKARAHAEQQRGAQKQLSGNSKKATPEKDSAPLQKVTFNNGEDSQ